MTTFGANLSAMISTNPYLAGMIMEAAADARSADCQSVGPALLTYGWEHRDSSLSDAHASAFTLANANDTSPAEALVLYMEGWLSVAVLSPLSPDSLAADGVLDRAIRHFEPALQAISDYLLIRELRAEFAERLDHISHDKIKEALTWLNVTERLQAELTTDTDDDTDDDAFSA
jgi:hypothetical protein